VSHLSLTDRALLIVVAPFLLLGAVLTISLIGAYFGLPLLLVTVPPAMVAWRVRTAPSDSVQLGRFAIASTLVASALTLTTIATAAGGLDDLDTPLEWGLFAVAVAWVAAAWWIARRTRTLSAAR
jgi:hypothetical protein